jgi:hypothetical protein
VMINRRDAAVTRTRGTATAAGVLCAASQAGILAALQGRSTNMRELGKLILRPRGTERIL